MVVKSGKGKCDSYTPMYGIFQNTLELCIAILVQKRDRECSMRLLLNTIAQSELRNAILRSAFITFEQNKQTGHT